MFVYEKKIEVKLFALNKYAVSHILLPMAFYVHSLNCTDIT